MALAVVTVSCHRYPEDHTLSLHQPEYRIVGVWEVTHCYLNGQETDSTGHQANNVRTYYQIYADHVMSVRTFYNGDFRQSTMGIWSLAEKDRKLSMDFTLVGRRYSYLADIKRLSREELAYEYLDDDGNLWRLEMNSRLPAY